jgi:hypothetical protein
MYVIEVDERGSMMVVGFHDGVIRILQMMKNTPDNRYGRVHSDEKAILSLVQALKPHSDRVTCCAVNILGSVLATGVSQQINEYIIL